MVVSMGIDAVPVSSSHAVTPSSPSFSIGRSNRISSYSALYRNILASSSSPLSRLESNSSLSSAHRRIKGFHSPTSGGSRISGLSSSKNLNLTRHRNPLSGYKQECTSCAAQRSRGGGQWDAALIGKIVPRSRVSKRSSGCSPDIPVCRIRRNGLITEKVDRVHFRRRTSIIVRCEADDGVTGGVSYNDRPATVVESVGEDGNNAGRKSTEYESEAENVRAGNGALGEDGSNDALATSQQPETSDDDDDDSAVEVLDEILRVANEELQKRKLNREMLEEKAQSVAERAIALMDEAKAAQNKFDEAIAKVEELSADESRVMEELQKATASKGGAEGFLRTAEAALQTAIKNARLQDKVDATKAEDEAKKKAKEETRDEAREAGSESQEAAEYEAPAEGREEEEEEQEAEVKKMVEAMVGVTTERTIDIRVADGGSAEPEVVKEKGTVLAQTSVTVQGETAEIAVAIATAIMDETEALESAKSLVKSSDVQLGMIESQLLRIRSDKVKYEQGIERLREMAVQAEEVALEADEHATDAMAEAEQAVAAELEAGQKVSDIEVARQKALKLSLDAEQQAQGLVSLEAEKLAQSVGKTLEEIEEELETRAEELEAKPSGVAGVEDASAKVDEEVKSADNESVGVEEATGPPEVVSAATEKISKSPEPGSKKVAESDQQKEAETVKEPPLPKAAKKRSSRFFPASYFSSGDGEEFAPSKAYAEFASSIKGQLAKIVIGTALLLAGGAYVNHRFEKQAVTPPTTAYSSTVDQAIDTAAAEAKPLLKTFKKLSKRVVELVDKIPAQEVNAEEASLFDVLWLLLASVIFVPLFTKIPGGSPVLGYLVAGILIGPHTIHIIQHVHGTKAIAEFGVVFLLFNIGLELSVERLSSMKKYVFGLGTTQVLATAASVCIFLNQVSKITGPSAIIIASGLALSSTAVVLQVLQERGESTSRHGRATFSVLLFQDLAVVVLLIMIPLLSSKGGVGLAAIASALGAAGIKAVIAIGGIIASGRLFLRPIYKQMADNHNPEIFAANTLLVVLGTSVLTARAGLSMALGAFLAGLLLAETEFALQVESDIAPYRGLLLGLFFMTVGMSIDPKLFVARFPEIMTALALLITGKTLLVGSVGRLFGLSPVAAVRTGLLLAPGGEFAFVAFGEAVNQGLMSPQLSSLLYLVVGLSMALTPWLAAGGQVIAAKFEQQDVRSLLPQENETDDLQGHIIICGFGRVGQIIAQLLAERLIPFVALDVRSDRVSVGRQLDLPVFFGDAGSKEVLHKVGAQRAAAAVITLDTPGANYRTVWALCKHFPGVKTFVRAHDVDHGLNLEKAGATAVIPETLEPSLQLAAAVLAQAKIPANEIASAIDDFRSRHLAELAELSGKSGTSLGYGFSKLLTKPLIESIKAKVDDEETSGNWVEGTIVAVP